MMAVPTWALSQSFLAPPSFRCAAVHPCLRVDPVRSAATCIAPGPCPILDKFVQVADCSQPEEAGRFRSSLNDYLSYWREHHTGADPRLLYLKDWHFAAEYPEYGAYTCPEYFKDDWLNLYFAKRRRREGSGEKHAPGRADGAEGQTLREGDAPAGGSSAECSDYRRAHLPPPHCEVLFRDPATPGQRLAICARLRPASPGAYLCPRCVHLRLPLPGSSTLAPLELVPISTRCETGGRLREQRRASRDTMR